MEQTVEDGERRKGKEREPWRIKHSRGKHRAKVAALHCVSGCLPCTEQFKATAVHTLTQISLHKHIKYAAAPHK